MEESEHYMSGASTKIPLIVALLRLRHRPLCALMGSTLPTSPRTRAWLLIT